ncbi:hypothetical protein AAC387_Pa04g0472 [Persea americana]
MMTRSCILQPKLIAWRTFSEATSVNNEWRKAEEQGGNSAVEDKDFHTVIQTKVMIVRAPQGTGSSVPHPMNTQYVVNTSFIKQ